VAGQSGRTTWNYPSLLIPKVQNDQVGIYYEQPSYDAPTCYVSREQARKYKDEGLGWYINHGRDFRMGDGAKKDSDRRNRPSSMDDWVKRRSGLPEIGYVEVWQLTT